jgi:3-oxoacyl-[acyl-carrier-protein] synthase-3
MPRAALNAVEAAAAGAPAPLPHVAAGITGIAAALPPALVTNDDIAAGIGVDGRWIERRTGIRNRRHAAPGERLSDLAADAARAALRDAGVAASELDAVLVATITADEITPGAAPLVAAALGSHCAAIDVNGACVGFLHALDMGAAMIGAGRARTVLVIGAETLSRILDLGDRRTAGLFGDGAGAAVLTAGAGSVAPFVLRSAGEHAHVIRAPRDTGVVRMEGHETFLLATAALSEVAVEACEAAGVALADIDLFVFHQANSRILTAVAERLDLERERVVDVIADVGNTSAASLPIALAQVRPRSGDRVLLGAMGAGFLYGAGVLTWP